jgi:hypothetical protein
MERDLALLGESGVGGRGVLAAAVGAEDHARPRSRAAIELDSASLISSVRCAFRAAKADPARYPGELSLAAILEHEKRET